jgi:glycerol-3-phosphate dehydrogenase
MKTRADALREVATGPFDVCVIGAGASGAGCALDAQLRGLRTVLVDAGDFASATSSASTKLVHGGVRYLQEAVTDLDLGQLKVVKHALRERILMLQNAPYLAHPLEFIVPCFSRFQLAYYGVGMKIYEWIAGDASVGDSRILSRDAALRELPGMNGPDLKGAVAYWDGQFDDARYGIALVKTLAEAGGQAVNYLRVVGFERGSDGRLSAAIAEDSFSRQRIVLRARAFINATGPFSDHLRTLVNPGVAKRLAPSKGVHILLPLDPGLDSALLIPETEDGRVIFAIPWLGRLLVGTTDQEVTLNEDLTVTQAEAEYLLRHLNRYLAKSYTTDEVVSAFAGVRPLVRAGHAQTKRLVRDHEVEVDRQSGLVSILGGKWTTYRHMAEDTIDTVQRLLGQTVERGKTQNHRLTGTQGFTPEYWRTLVREHQLAESTARHLAEKFGSEAAAVLQLAKDRPELRSPIVSGGSAIQAEIVYGIRQEMACTIEDVLARRTGLQQCSWAMALEAAPVVASHLASEGAWPGRQQTEATETYVAGIRRMQRTIGCGAATQP